MMVKELKLMPMKNVEMCMWLCVKGYLEDTMTRNLQNLLILNQTPRKSILFVGKWFVSYECTLFCWHMWRQLGPSAEMMFPLISASGFLLPLE